jgi:hypothetical protein
MRQELIILEVASGIIALCADHTGLSAAPRLACKRLAVTKISI